MRLLVLATLSITACGGDGGDGTPFVDASSSSDAAPSAFGLQVVWTAAPSLPGPVNSELVVTTASFRVKRLQVIGDAGAGPATAATNLDVAWTSLGTPPAVLFDAAPIGLYSKISVELDAGGPPFAYELEGTTKIGNMIEPYRIFDTAGLDLELDDVDVEVVPGLRATITLDLDLEAALEAVDYPQLPIVAGVRTLGVGDAQLANFRAELSQAFKSR